MRSKRPLGIRDLLKRVSAYEHLAPLNPQLRNALAVGGLVTLLAILLPIFLMPVLLGWSLDGFFWFLDGLYVGGLAFLRTPLVLVINSVALLAHVAMLYKTEGLRADLLLHLYWHRFALGLVALGAVNLLLLGVPVFGVLLQTALWLAVILFFIVILFAVIFGSAGRR